MSGRETARCYRYDQPIIGFHQAVAAFKRDLIRTVLEGRQGNRTHAARALGLQRTYLIRLIKLFRIDVATQRTMPTLMRGR